MTKVRAPARTFFALLCEVLNTYCVKGVKEERKEVSMENPVDSYGRFLNGDDKGLEEIICTYKDGLMIFLNGIVKNLNIAEELTEETFVKLVLKRPRFLRSSAFKTWLYAIARNLALDHLRRHAGRTVTSLDEYPEFFADEVSLEQSYIHKEEKIMLHRTMQKLKDEYQQILWLIYFEGFTYRDAAKIMKKSTHSVETLAYRARQSLKRKLIEEGFIYEEL